VAWAECAWEVEARDDHAHRVMPDGCMDLVWTEGGGLRVAGPSTVAFDSPMARGTSAVGVRMRPGGAPPLLGLSPEGLRDAAPSAREVLGSGAARLEEAIARAPGAHARRDLMLDWLGGRAVSARAPDPLVLAAATRLAADPGMTLGPLARDLGVGGRHLRRRVAAAVGYGPKRLARVLRLLRALDIASREPGLGWAGVAHRAGYADQSHLSRDCSDLAGVPPAALLAG
jgi:AraC-like DNA-binding protein